MAGKCCCRCCRFCCATIVEEETDGVTRGKELPEARTTVETYDFTSENYKRSNVEQTTSATSFMTFTPINNDHPTDLDRKAAIGNTNENQLCYVRLDGADEVAMGLRRLSMKQHKTLDIPEEATRL